MALVATMLRLFHFGVERIPNIWILDEEAGASTSRCTELLLDTSDYEFERKVLGALAGMRGL